MPPSSTGIFKGKGGYEGKTHMGWAAHTRKQEFLLREAFSLVLQNFDLFWNLEIVKTNVSISNKSVCFHSSYLCTIKGKNLHFALVGGFFLSRWANIGQLSSDCLCNSRFKPLRHWDLNAKVSFFSGLSWTNIQVANILWKVKYLLYWSAPSLCVKFPTTHWYSEKHFLGTSHMYTSKSLSESIDRHLSMPAEELFYLVLIQDCQIHVLFPYACSHLLFTTCDTGNPPWTSTVVRMWEIFHLQHFS